MAGRAFAAYGGIYILMSLGWLWLAEGQRPDRPVIAGMIHRDGHIAQVRFQGLLGFLAAFHDFQDLVPADLQQVGAEIL